jgi:hypothetical protein
VPHALILTHEPLLVASRERPLLLSRADTERIADHEGGHTILGGTR